MKLMTSYIREPAGPGFMPRNLSHFTCRWHLILHLTASLSLLSAGPTAFNQANDLYRRGRFTAALIQYEKALKEGGSPALVFFNMGNAYYQLEKPDMAIGCYQSAVLESPDFFAAYLNLGILYHAQEDWPSAAVIMEQARVMEPNNKDVLLILSVAYKNLQAWARAVECLTRALETDSSLVDCYFLLYDIHQELGDRREARRYLNNYPDDARRADEKYRLLGNMAENNGNLDKAAFYYGRQARMAPENRWARYKLVEVIFNSGKALLALETAKEALQDFNDFGELALLAGNIAFKSEYWPDAVSFYAKAHRLGEARGLVGLQNMRKMNKATQSINYYSREKQ
jgi:tetratricopeptide (TPR) repeat protein